MLLAAPRKRRRLTNARKLSESKLSVFKHLFESSNHRDDRKDERKIQRLKQRVSGLIERMKALNVRMKAPNVEGSINHLQLKVDNLWVRIGDLRIRVTVLQRERRDRNRKRLQLKMSYLKDKAIKKASESKIVSKEIACAMYDKAMDDLSSVIAIGPRIDNNDDDDDESIHDMVDKALNGIIECGRAPTKQLAMGDWEDEMTKSSDLEMMHQQRRRRLILDDDDSDDEEKNSRETQGVVLSGVHDRV